MQIAALEALPTDWIYSFVMEDEPIPFSPAFEDLGLEHHLFLNNFGTLGFVFALMPLIYLGLFFASYCACCRCWRRCKKKLNRQMYWGVLLRSIIEGYVISLTCCLINMRMIDLSSESTKWTFGNSIITLIVFPILMIFPFYGVYHMNKYREKLNDASI